jgi:hypothetical protein
MAPEPDVSTMEAQLIILAPENNATSVTVSGDVAPLLIDASNIAVNTAHLPLPNVDLSVGDRSFTAS